MDEAKPTTRMSLERTYGAAPEQVWALWTTKPGIESWWGPEGFSVTVDAIDLQPGGELRYTMTATAPEQAQFMTQAGMPLATPCVVTYTEVEPLRRLGYRTRTDFVPGVEPYDVHTTVAIEDRGDGVRMLLTFDQMHDEEWTRRATMGHEGQLAKLDRVLGASGT